MPGPLQYGNGIKALTIDLLVAQMLSLRRCTELEHAITGLKISEATQGNRLNKPLTRLYFLNRGVRAHLFFRRFRMSCTPNDSTAPAFLTHFQAVEDPRQEGKVLYPL